MRPIEDGEQWRVTTVKYNYDIAERRAPNVSYMGWHWHPQSQRSEIHEPHFHMPAGSPHGTRHIPTGRVALEDIILFGFRELNVPEAYSGAERNVRSVLDTHRKYRSW